MNRLGLTLGILRHGPARAATLMERVRALPCRRLERALPPGAILVVAPHPDDETLGCGGLIQQARAAGRRVHILVVTDGAASHPSVDAGTLTSRRRSETLAAALTLGVDEADVTFWTIPDGAAPWAGRQARLHGEALARLARDVGAATLLTTWDLDTHPDHVAASIYARRGAAIVGAALFAYPIWAWMIPPAAWLPNRPVTGFSLDVTAQSASRDVALRCHASQFASYASANGEFSLSAKHVETMLSHYERFIAVNATSQRFLAHGHCSVKEHLSPLSP